VSIKIIDCPELQKIFSRIFICSGERIYLTKCLDSEREREREGGAEEETSLPSSPGGNYRR